MKNTIKYLISAAGMMSALLLQSCGNSNEKSDASGVFESTEIIVSSEASGKLLKFDLLEGQRLSAGQEVGCTDTVQLYLKKLQLLANVKTVQSRRPDINKQIAATEQQIATAKTEKHRVENLLKSNAATQKQLDDATSLLSVLEKQLSAQRSSLDITNKGIAEESGGLAIQIKQLDDQLRKCHIINPSNGTVLSKYAQQGEITAQGKALYKIADVDNLFLRAYITSAQLLQIKIGQQVTILADNGDKDYRKYTGTVSWISDKAEFTPKTIQTKDERANLVYAVKIAVPNDGRLKIGMYGEVKL